ncbi:hypothetical protein SLA2020_480660 [Shorea laevis]
MATQGSQRVVVIQDASRELSTCAIRWAVQGLSLKPGDELILLGVLHQANNPSTFSFMGAGKLLGYKIKVDSSSMFETNRKIIAEEIVKEEEEYKNNAEIVEISKQCKSQQIEFVLKVQAGSPSKMVAQRAAKKLNAT